MDPCLVQPEQSEGQCPDVLKNGGFEAGLTFWEASDRVTVVKDTKDAHSGTYAG